MNAKTDLPALVGGRSLDYYLTPFKAFLEDPDLTEIAVNRPGEIWTEGKAWDVHSSSLSYSDMINLAKLVASHNKKSISTDKPVLSASFPGGERVQFVMPPACEPNTVSLTVRKASLIDKNLEELEAEGAFEECALITEGIKPHEQELLELRKSGQIREFLHKAVLYKLNILIVGKTGSGKTTITKSLIRSIPPEERLVTIEDVHELDLKHHRNKVHLFYSRDDEGGAAKVTAKQALASCLRMKPDRILLAELRGDEAWDYIKSINTGHPGSISTLHANSAEDAFEQATALIKDSKTGAHLDVDYVRSRLYSTIDIVLFYDKRKLREIYFNPEKKRANMA